MPTYRCVICNHEVSYESGLPRLYPFCSSRCKMVDLGRWLREDYTIDRDLGPEDVDQIPPPEPRERDQ